ncbi:hypothetical protein [Pseudomonas sp. NPDC089406]|uniref:hypothetical protein n=1 Tax=Pseudomonas sp. NPDC089406 TaxID=3364463 RepID=UPI00384A949F
MGLAGSKEVGKVAGYVDKQKVLEVPEVLEGLKAASWVLAAAYFLQISRKRRIVLRGLSPMLMEGLVDAMAPDGGGAVSPVAHGLPCC